jgi:hypothetical protein
MENVDLQKGIEVFVKIGGLPIGCNNISGFGLVE